MSSSLLAQAAPRKCEDLLTGQQVLRALSAVGRWEAEVFDDRPESAGVLFIMLQLLAEGRMEKDAFEDKMEVLANRARETNRKSIAYLSSRGYIARIRTGGKYFFELTPEGREKVVQMLLFTGRN